MYRGKWQFFLEEAGGGKYYLMLILMFLDCGRHFRLLISATRYLAVISRLKLKQHRPPFVNLPGGTA